MHTMRGHYSRDKGLDVSNSLVKLSHVLILPECIRICLIRLRMTSSLRHPVPKMCKSVLTSPKDGNWSSIEISESSCGAWYSGKSGMSSFKTSYIQIKDNNLLSLSSSSLSLSLHSSSHTELTANVDTLVSSLS